MVWLGSSGAAVADEDVDVDKDELLYISGVENLLWILIGDVFGGSGSGSGSDSDGKLAWTPSVFVEPAFCDSMSTVSVISSISTTTSASGETVILIQKKYRRSLCAMDTCTAGKNPSLPSNIRFVPPLSSILLPDSIPSGVGPCGRAAFK